MKPTDDKQLNLRYSRVATLLAFALLLQGFVMMPAYAQCDANHYRASFGPRMITTVEIEDRDYDELIVVYWLERIREGKVMDARFGTTGIHRMGRNDRMYPANTPEVNFTPLELDVPERNFLRSPESNRGVLSLLHPRHVPVTSKEKVKKPS